MSESIRTKFPRTIFCLGGRGHYENPTSDLLKFFLDPKEEHGLKRLFIEAMIMACPSLASCRLEAESLQIEREVDCSIGEDRGRIDLLLRSEDQIWLIENKHWHHSQDNPFDLYQRFVQERYQPADLRLLVLDFKNGSYPVEWTTVRYRDLLTAIENSHSLPEDPPKEVRWSVLTHEFLKHLRLEAHAFTDGDIKELLAVLDDETVADEPEADKESARAALVHFIQSTLDRVTTDAWTAADDKKGWRGGDAIAFRVRHDEVTDVEIWFCVRLRPAHRTSRCVMVAWMRGQVRPTLGSGWEDLPKPNAQFWEDADASWHELHDDLRVALDEFSRELAKVLGKPSGPHAIAN